jgi:peptide deformylase
MDAELLYRTKLREIEREAQRIHLISAAKEARHRPAASKTEEGCLSIPRLLRTLRPASW